MKHAFSAIRDQPHYRHEAFISGLKRVGFHVDARLPDRPPQLGEVLVIWNRYSDREHTADAWEKKGGTVLVAENGYVGADAQGRQYYALAKHGHAGSGTWPVGDGSRWAQLGIDLKPWRAEGAHVVVFGQRGIGSRTMASPPEWHTHAEARLRKITKRAVRVRPHPGKPANDVEVIKDTQAQLAGAHAAVIWSSANGVRALIEGIPVFHDAPRWICESAAVRGIEKVEEPKMDDAARLGALERMAWAQWTVDEIASGEPFARLLA